MVNESPLRVGQIISGRVFNEPMRAETVRSQGPDVKVVGLVDLLSEHFRSVALTSADLKAVTVLKNACSFDGDGKLLLGLQAYSLGIAYQFDPSIEKDSPSLKGVSPKDYARPAFDKQRAA